jgi:hypothetical protein
MSGRFASPLAGPITALREDEVGLEPVVDARRSGSSSPATNAIALARSSVGPSGDPTRVAADRVVPRIARSVRPNEPTVTRIQRSALAASARQVSADSGDRVIRRVEAGEVPIVVTLASPDRTLQIKGLINCVGVLIRIYGGMDHIAFVGGHFVTPRMFDTDTGALTAEGVAFTAAIAALLLPYPPGDWEPVYYVKKPAQDGANPVALQEATAAANAIMAALPAAAAGQIVQTAGDINEGL